MVRVVRSSEPRAAWPRRGVRAGLLGGVLVASVVGLAGCGGSDDDTSRPFVTSFGTTRFEIDVTPPGGAPERWGVENRRTVRIDGEPYLELAVGAGDDAVVGWVAERDGGWALAGGELYLPDVGAPNVPDATLALDAPAFVRPSDWRVGDTVRVPIEGSARIGPPDAPLFERSGSDAVVLEVLSDDEVVDTSLGAVVGAQRVRFASEEGDADGIRGEAWVHPELGLVDGWVEVPVLGRYALSMAGYRGAEARGDHGVVQGEAVLTPDGLSYFGVSSMDLAGTFDADKDQHATMIVEARWADEERARTSEPPPVTPSCTTAIGWYPAFLVESPVSLLHPGDGETGMRYWVAVVDQAAKNEADNPIVYSAGAWYQGDEGDVRVGAKVVYVRYRP